MFVLISSNYGTILRGFKPTKAITSSLRSRRDCYAWGTFLLEKPLSKANSNSNYPLIPSVTKADNQ